MSDTIIHNHYHYYAEPKAVTASAIDAAAQAIFSRSYDVNDWDKVTNQIKARYHEDAKAALEAAMPYLDAGGKEADQ